MSSGYKYKKKRISEDFRLGSMKTISSNNSRTIYPESKYYKSKLNRQKRKSNIRNSQTRRRQSKKQLSATERRERRKLNRLLFTIRERNSEGSSDNIKLSDNSLSSIIKRS